MGSWRSPAHGALIEVFAHDARMVARLGTEPAQREMTLVPLGQGRALGDAWDGPWRRRPCFVLQDDRLRVVSNRSRVLEYVRA
jgi:hypothetical protein